MLDTETNAWLVTANYWDEQVFGDLSMQAPFTLDEPKKVRVILSNWSPIEARSHWTLRSATVVTTP